MIDKMRVSRLLQMGLLLTFLLPFFPGGCAHTNDDTKNYKIADSTRVLDSIAAIEAMAKRISDSIDIAKQDSILLNEKGSSKQANQQSTSITDELSKKFSILKIFLRPNDDYSGLALVIELFSDFIFEFGIVFAFIPNPSIGIKSLMTVIRDFIQ